jgi:hypothetical protein
MKKNIARGVLAVVLGIAFTVGLVAVATPVVASSCETQCYQDYQQCVPYCSKHPCFASCETVLEICLSNCGSTE